MISRSSPLNGVAVRLTTLALGNRSKTPFPTSGHIVVSLVHRDQVKEPVWKGW